MQLQKAIADTLGQTGGIPDVATRLTALVIAAFVLAVLWLLVWMRMKEADERLGKGL